MRGTVRQEPFAGQWTDTGLLLNFCRTAKLLGQHQLRARSGTISPKLARARAGW